jgi:hypothetical protein
MYRRKMEKQMSNVKSVRTLMLPEPSDDSKGSLLLLPQVQANNRLTPDKSTPTSGNKNLRHQLPHSSDAKMIHLVPTDCMRETSSGTSSATGSKFTVHRKPTWEPLFPLEITSKIPQWSDASKPTSASQLLRSKKEVLDTADPRQVPTPEVDRSVLASDVIGRVPSTQWLKKVEAKMK